MRQEETYTSRFKTHVRFHIYEPKVILRSRAVVMIHHALGESAETYRHFAFYLVDRGYIVVVSDTVGHGRSLINFEQGYFGENEANVMNDLMADMHHLQEVILLRYGDLPYFMIGVGLGGWLVRKYASLYGDYLAGIIIISSPCYISGQAFLETRLNFLRAIKGKLHHPLEGDEDFRKSLSAKLGDHPLDFLMHDEKAKKELDEDTMMYFTSTVQGYLDLFRLMRDANSLKTDQKVPKELSIYVLGGDEDPLIHNGNDVKKIYKQLEAQKITDVSYHLYEHQRHALLHDDNKIQVYRDIASWLDERTFL